MAANSNPFTCSILTPQAALVDHVSATIVTCPGEEGDLGILAGHTPLITALRSGKIQLRNGENIFFSMNILQGFGGLLHVNPNHVTITLDHFCPLCGDLSLKGHEFMPKTLRIECSTCGSYKIDSDVVASLSEVKRKDLCQYVKNNPNVYIAKENLVSISSDKAA